MIHVTVNGREREVPKHSTAHDLLQALGLLRDGVAVAINHRVVPRSQLPQLQLEPGAQIEIIRAVGGG